MDLAQEVQGVQGSVEEGDKETPSSAAAAAPTAAAAETEEENASPSPPEEKGWTTEVSSQTHRRQSEVHARHDEKTQRPPRSV